MDRGIKDEGFVCRALGVATSENGRWIANQATFNGRKDDKLLPTTHAALITSVVIFSEKYKWSEDIVNDAVKADTHGKARNLIDKLSDKLPKKT